MADNNIIPMHQNVLIRPLEEKESLTPGGLVIPETYEKNIQEGTVIAVGPGRRLDSGQLAKPDVRPGTHVIWHSKANTVEVLGVGEESLVLIDERSLVAKRTTESTVADFPLNPDGSPIGVQ